MIMPADTIATPASVAKPGLSPSMGHADSVAIGGTSATNNDARAGPRISMVRM